MDRSKYKKHYNNGCINFNNSKYSNNTPVIILVGDIDNEDKTDLSKFGINGNYSPLDTTNWLNDIGIYQYSFGEAQNRKEIDVRDKFIKIRIRYSGEELAIIDFLNTIY